MSVVYTNLVVNEVQQFNALKVMYPKKFLSRTYARPGRGGEAVYVMNLLLVNRVNLLYPSPPCPTYN